MSEIDALTVQWSDDAGTVVVNELDKKIVQRGSWATVVFKYEERDRKTNEMVGPKFAIRRYRSRGDRYEVHAKFVLTGEDQARDVATALLKWLGDASE